METIEIYVAVLSRTSMNSQGNHKALTTRRPNLIIKGRKKLYNVFWTANAKNHYFHFHSQNNFLDYSLHPLHHLCSLSTVFSQHIMDFTIHIHFPDVLDANLIFSSRQVIYILSDSVIDKVRELCRFFNVGSEWKIFSSPH